MKKITVLFIVLVVLIVLFLIIYTDQRQNRRSQSIYVEINDLKVRAQVAESFREKISGLSGRQEMPEQEGMFFIFHNPGRHSFWMRNMSFPLDIIWFNENLEVVEIKKNVQPDSFPQVYQSDDSAKYVLEINAGLSDRYNIRRGDKCSLEKIDD